MEHIESKIDLSPNYPACFDSLIGIRRSEITILAIGKLKNTNQSFLVRILKISPTFFTKTAEHLQKSSKISHPNVQRFHLITDADSCCIYLLYEPEYTMLERIADQKLFSKQDLSIFISHIQLGLSAQKAALNSENNFLDEWNIFQLENRFTVGASLPFKPSTCLLPFDKSFENLNCKYYKPSIEPALEKNFQNSSHDAYFLGVLVLKLIVREQVITKIIDNYSHKSFESAFKELFNECKEKYEEESINTLRLMLCENQMLLPVNFNQPIIFEPAKLKTNFALPVFDSFRNGNDSSTEKPEYLGHHDTISSLALSTDDRFLVSGSSDCTVKLYDFKEKRLLHTFHNAHQGGILTVAISPDNRLIASGSHDHSLKIYSLINKSCIYSQQSYHNDTISCLLFTKDSRYLVSGSYDNSIKILCLDSLSDPPLRIANAHEDGVTALLLVDNGRTLISVSFDTTIRAFDLATGRLIKVIRELHTRAIFTLSATEKIVATGSSDRSIRVFSLKTYRVLATFKQVHQDIVRTICLTSDSQYLISGSTDSCIKIFNVMNRLLIHSFNGVHLDRIYCVLHTSDNKRIISCSVDCTIKVFNLSTFENEFTFEIKPNYAVKTLIITPDDRYIVTGAADCSIKIFDVETRSLVHVFENAHSDWVMGLCATSNCELLVSSSPDKSIAKWDLKNKKKLSSVQGADTSWILCMQLSPNNQWVVTGSRDCSIRVFDFTNLALTHRIQNAHIESIRAVKITSDNKFVISASEDGSIKVFNVLEGLLHCSFPAHSHWIKSLVLSTDDQHLISGSADLSLGIYDIQSGVISANHPDIHADCLATSSQSTLIVSGSRDGMIKLHRFTRPKKFEWKALISEKI